MNDEERKKIGGILGFSFLDCGADLADGGRLRLKDADGISLRETADSLVLSVKFGGLCGEFSFVRTPDKIEKATRAVHTYLSGMYGPHLLMPPYTKFGGKCGRLQKHRPGTFSNGAIYLHGAAFKFAADCVRGDYAEALDTVQRILPNHEDNCDSRRTSEPYCVGNVYFGVSHPCYGLNL